ncbi:MAG: glucose-1-phosphate cytidylyltransferase [Dehalococcoidales bacterium]
METSDSKVVILCGGRGVRFHEATELRPKPLIEIGGRPILWHIMKTYGYYGHQDFILCLGYRGEMIKRHFLDYELMNCDFTVQLGRKKKIELHNTCQEQGWKVTLAETGINAMTGARIKRIEKYVDSDLFLLTYGDAVTNLNISNLVDFHHSHKKIGTITAVSSLSRFGDLKIGRGNLVEEFREKAPIHGSYINGGFFVFDRRLFDYVDDDDSCSFERQPLERLAKDGQLAAYVHDGYWQCMDTYRDWEILEQAWNTNNPPWKVWG